MAEKKLEKRKNVEILVLSIIVVILLGIIIYLLNIKKDNNNEPSNNSSNVVEKSINSELENVVSFAKKDDTTLIAITGDGKEITIFDKKSYYEFYYDYDNEEKIIYLSLFENDKKRLIGLIDLKKGNGKYDIKILKELDNNDEYFYYGAANITKINNYIFFGNKTIFRYDLTDNKIENMNISSKNRYIWFDKYKSNLLYQFDKDIYMLDVNTKKSSKILSNSSLGYVYNNKLVYYLEDNNSENGNRYYIYDFITKNIQQISNYFGRQSLNKDYIIPFKDKLYSFNEGLDLYVFEDNKLNKFYTLSCDDFNEIINDCNNNKILTGIFDFVKISDSNILLYLGYVVSFNINTKKVEEVKESYNYYSDVYYVK